MLVQAIRRGSQTNFEKDFRSRFVPLAKQLQKLETQLSRVLAESLRNPKKSTAYWRAVRAEANRIYSDMGKAFSSWSQKEIPARYRRSLRQMQRRIEASKAIINTASKGITSLIESTATGQISAALWSDATESFFSALITGKRNVARLTRATQQALIQETLIDANVAKAIVDGNLRKAITNISASLATELERTVGGKRFVQAGSRKFRATDYAEIVARTKFHETHSAAAVAQARNYDTDLIQVSTHNTTTAICQPFEGKIFSFNGKDKRFPPLIDTPPFHPNCLHLLFPTFVSAMETQGTLDEFSEFSKDKISKPPVPSSFIPVGSR